MATYLAHIFDGIAAFSYTYTNSNVLALGTLGVLGKGEIIGGHWLQPPTASLNTTFALSITCFLYFNWQGIKAHGLFGYLKHFLGPILALAPMMFLIEMIGNFARALSLSMRLYGNIFGEHTATGIFTSLVPIIVPWPMLALGIFGALLQAYVFTLLTTVYLGGATASEH